MNSDSDDADPRGRVLVALSYFIFLGNVVLASAAALMGAMAWRNFTEGVVCMYRLFIR